MSYAVRRIDLSVVPGSSGQAPPTTATVLDYNCLFTHDLKRKQKRWQDGRLKYHTFNGKIMVYDDRGNFIGDTHWHTARDLEEDEELELDRGAAIVQVSNCVGSRQQDLTEVLDKRMREVEKRRAFAAAKAPTSNRMRVTPAAQDSEHFQLNHRPLSAIVPSPGPIGRASISSRSPFEARRADQLGAQKQAPPPPAKKRRTSPSPPNKSVFARSLFGATLSLASHSAGTLSSLRMRTMREKVNLVEPEVGKTNDGNDKDDGVVVVGERPKSKLFLLKSINVEKVALARPAHKKQEEHEPLDVKGPSRQSSDRFDEPPSGPGLDGVISKAAVEAQPERISYNVLNLLPASERLGEQQRSEMLRTTNISSDKSQKQTNPEKLTTRDTGLDELAPRQNFTVDEESQGGSKLASPQIFHSSQQTRIIAVRPGSPVPETPKPQEQRTELRIRPRKKRGLLVVMEKTQRQLAQKSLIPPLLSATSPDVEPATTIQQICLHQSQVRNSEECSVKAITEPAPSPQVASEEIHQVEKEAASLPNKREAIRLDSESELGVLVTKGKPSQVLEEEFVHAPNSERSDEQSKLEEGNDDETMPLAEQVNSKDRTGSIITNRDVNNIQPDFDEAMATSKDKSMEVVLKGDESKTMSDVVETAVLGYPCNELLGKHSQDRIGPFRSQQDSELFPVGCTTDSQHEDLPPKRIRRPRKSPEELLAAQAIYSGEEGWDISPRKRSKHKQTQKKGEINDMTSFTESSGPRIKKLSRKSVKSKEIFGFVPSLGDDIMRPAPFATAGPCIGTVGRPLCALNHLPGISLTIKPGLQKQSSCKNELRNVDDEQPARPGKADDEELEGVGPGEERPSDGAVPKKARIVNPATRGKKAARKADAAGQAPQNIVPLDPPQNSRGSSRGKPPEPKKSDANLPGFRTAKGGAWSRHAEDLLGMTRPTGKNGV